MSSLIDWDVAARSAKRFSPPPPSVSREEADQVVGELYQATSQAAGHVAELTRLDEPTVSSVTRVVDRPGWIDANTGGMRAIMTPLVDKLSADNRVGRIAEGIGGRVTGVQVGLVVGFLSGKVLGQFEFFDRPGGQLLLVAPNMLSVERQLGVDPRDFRLWVCLHEVTHRVQFTAVPWLRQHMLDEVSALTDAVETDPAVLRQRLAAGVGELVKVVRGQGDGSGVMSVIASPEQRVILDRVTAFMSLVEGHAEFVMNSVSPDVIPTQQAIEERFAQRRRKGGNPLDRLLRKLLGLEAKTRQYVDGSAFVRTVVDRIGIENFNAIWTSRETLPTKAEIATPGQWIARVHA
ncbi:MAG: zinc-dependent metalloprotease [Actinomycetota bacterium]|nr:zinc-dependent metalloprotease [Actinomycetota bacterium]